MSEKKITREIVLKDCKEELDRIKKVQEFQDKNEDKEQEDCEDHREPISIMKTTIIDIQLSWGGGADGFKLKFDKDNELMGGVYYMADWGEYEEIDLTDSEAEEVFNFYLYGEFPQQV
jgi:hypothetical protein